MIIGYLNIPAIHIQKSTIYSILNRFATTSLANILDHETNRIRI